MTTPEKILDPRLARELQNSIRIVGVRDTARAMGVNREKLEEMIVTREFEPAELERARVLRLIPAEEP